MGAHVSFGFVDERGSSISMADLRRRVPNEPRDRAPHRFESGGAEARAAGEHVQPRAIGAAAVPAHEIEVIGHHGVDHGAPDLRARGYDAVAVAQLGQRAQAAAQHELLRGRERWQPLRLRHARPAVAREVERVGEP